MGTPCKVSIDSYIPSLGDIILKSKRYGALEKASEDLGVAFSDTRKNVKGFIEQNPEKVRAWVEGSKEGFRQLEGRPSYVEMAAHDFVTGLANRYVDIVDVLRSNFLKTDEIRLFREMVVPDIGTFYASLQSGRVAHLGVYWAFTREKALAYFGKFGKSGEGDYVRIGATTGCESINYYKTIENYLIFSMESDYSIRTEDEINLIPSSEVRVFELCDGRATRRHLRPYRDVDCKAVDLVARI